MLSRVLVPSLVCALLVACSSSSDSSSTGSTSSANTISGTVGGSTLKPLSATAQYGTIGEEQVNSDPVKHIRGLTIRVTNLADSCTSRHFANNAFFEIAIRGDSVKPGTYPVVDAIEKSAAEGEASGNFNAVDGSCKDLVAQPSKSGTVTITRSDTRVTGTAEITFEGGKISGAFDAELCADAPASDEGNAAPFVCK